MKYLAMITILLLCTHTAYAVNIQSIYINAYNESGSEFIELYNNHTSTINLEGWTIATPTSQTDATLIGSIRAKKTFLITDAGWDEGKDNATWPTADHQEALTLPNTNGYVQLLNDQQELQAEMHWGEQGVANVEEGIIYLLQEDGSYKASNWPAPPQADLEQKTTLETTITNAKPRIIKITVEDDDTQEGIQLIPIPGNARTVPISITVEDNNSVQEVSITLQNTTYTLNSTNNTQQLNTTLLITTETTSTEIIVQDEKHTITHTLNWELLPVVGIQTTKTLNATLEPGKTSSTMLIVENTGTANTTLQLKGTTPLLGQAVVKHITYTLEGENHTLTKTFRAHHTIIEPGQTLAINVHVTAGFIPAGTYTGNIVIAGVKA